MKVKVNKMSRFIDLSGSRDGGRRTGRSTALALEYISDAIKLPGVNIAVSDHHGTTQADHFLLDMIQDYVDLLGLRQFTYIHGAVPVIRFDLYEEIDLPGVDGILVDGRLIQ